MGDVLPVTTDTTEAPQKAPAASPVHAPDAADIAKGREETGKVAAAQKEGDADAATASADADKLLADDKAAPKDGDPKPPEDPAQIAARKAETGSMPDAVKEAGKGAREFFGGILGELKNTVAKWIPTQMDTALQEIKTNGSLSWMTKFGLQASLIFSKQIPKDSLKDFSDADKKLLTQGCGLQIKDVEKTAGSTVDMVELGFKSESMDAASVEKTRFESNLRDGLRDRKGGEEFEKWLTPQLEGKNIGALKAELAKAPDDQKESANALLQVLSKMGATDGDDARVYMTENMNRLLLEFKSVPVVEPVIPPAEPATPPSAPTTT